jgi:glycoprotein-N-acetylgalactosamine 3-beta-galactosyltransferase
MAVVFCVYGTLMLSSETAVLEPTATSISTTPKIESLVCQDPVASFLKVLDPPHRRPKILCLILTQQSNHMTRLKAVHETWGRKCDKIIAASDLTDSSLDAYKIKSMSGYLGIWDKLMQTLKLVVNQTLVEEPYDWILKADDDTFVIMENLQSFLAGVTNDATKDVPLVYGRTMPWPKLKALADEFPGWFKTNRNKQFGKRFFEKFMTNETLVYSHGGPGYAMNWKYAEILVDAYFHSRDVVKGKLSEDLANAVTMLYRDIRPSSTFDATTGKERSHPESPQTMYDNPPWLPWVQRSIQNLGKGSECCSPTSISYHHVTDHNMRVLEHQLYACPRLIEPIGQ